MKRAVLIIVMMLSVIGWIVPSTAMAEEKIHVTFVSCCQKEGFFWPKVDALMQAAADDLQIDVEVLYAEMDHLKMVKMVKEVVHRANPPDYLIVDNFKMQGGTMIREADAAGVKVFLMANGLNEEQTALFGKPREKYKHWIGELTPDNQFAGYQLAKELINQALDAGVTASDGKLHLAAISGDFVTPASVQRVAGLEQAVAEYPNVELKQVVPGQWDEQRAQGIAIKLAKRYPELGALWVANDEMALAAMNGLLANGKTPGKDIFVGGINWKKEALEQVTKGKMSASIGGHFMLGAWSLVLLYDYHHGKDFADEGVQVRQRLFGVIDAQNVDQYLSVFGDENWQKIDFTRFSKELNPSLKKYDFSIEAILRQGF
ncbi:ABC transporter substrate-binding protein [Aeromonas sp. MdU4]|uniref:ABC transporter substrate-binding protein n=1 Tax=Aeromonas sp. MdU4 TaxID=3342819 RepID=UPI0035B73C77